jgi:hypothetical protein
MERSIEAEIVEPKRPLHLRCTNPETGTLARAAVVDAGTPSDSALDPATVTDLLEGVLKLRWPPRSCVPVAMDRSGSLPPHG